MNKMWRNIHFAFVWILAIGTVSTSRIALGYDIIEVPKHYPTIQDAVDHVKAGGWILVRPGTYNEIVRVRTLNVLIYGHPGEHPVVEGGFVVESDGVKIHEIDIKVTEEAVVGIALTGTDYLPQEEIELTNNIIYPSDTGAVRGIGLAVCIRCKISGNYIDGFELEGLAVHGNSKGTVIRGNTVVHNLMYGINLSPTSQFAQVIDNITEFNKTCDIIDSGLSNKIKRNDAAKLCR
ncbi:right-handed parallel beta-helix repeat-containing protein [Methylococcus mesophilus]|uniref:right-handed parallel beta-helix repeat-containing protein n=1 Tax=Methylococcus mesophilus TaxID=2993564 RepID=UPI00224B39B7|nr:right-handed parallel beta-helix repeat-containing protein [Methylococcus mesophilus]UZR29741.1 right-handed parallel beta-helix repeat-containing protein [Methylococcus mesophilus]